MFYDTHVHFERLEGEDGIASQVERARRAGVTRMLAVGANPELNAHAVEAARRFPGVVGAAIGMDRDQARLVNSAEAARDELREKIISLKRGGTPIVGLGEIGLDFHYAPETAPLQIALFRAQLDLARELDLPVIVHSREADHETLEALSEYAASRPDCGRLGVLHCFTGNRAFADRLVELGFFISFSGIVTFRNADALRAVSATVPPGRLLIETDTPWLSPAPHRGRRNEPAYVVLVAEQLARVRSCSTEEIAVCTTNNAIRLFDDRNARNS